MAKVTNEYSVQPNQSSQKIVRHHIFHPIVTTLLPDVRLSHERLKIGIIAMDTINPMNRVNRNTGVSSP